MKVHVIKPYHHQVDTYDLATLDINWSLSHDEMINALHAYRQIFSSHLIDARPFQPKLDQIAAVLKQYRLSHRTGPLLYNRNAAKVAEVRLRNTYDSIVKPYFKYDLVSQTLLDVNFKPVKHAQEKKPVRAERRNTVEF